ncbi:hypothetical protein TUM17383_28590 [Shewanella algae]|nr:hypothetical protein TUM17383_28590 [Shewanella algae]
MLLWRANNDCNPREVNADVYKTRSGLGCFSSGKLSCEGAIVIEEKVSRKGHIQGRMPLDHN